jgi:glycerophosphoryl diester phosphodiesterase
MDATQHIDVTNDVNDVFIQSKTMQQVIRCLDLRASGLSVSVQCNRDNTPFIFSDMKVDSQTRGSGFFCYHSNEDVAALDIDGESVPTLAWVLARLFERKNTLPKDFTFHIEINHMESVDAICAMIKMQITSLRLPASFFTISSKNMPLLERVKKILPMVQRAATVRTVPVDYAEQFVKLGVSAVHIDHEFLDFGLLRDALSRGLVIRVFNVLRNSDIPRLKEVGPIDIIKTDTAETL